MKMNRKPVPLLMGYVHQLRRQPTFHTHWVFARLVPLAVLAALLVAPAFGAPALVTNARSQEGPAASSASFIITRVHAPRLFHDMSSRSLRLDASQNPHVAYGGDQLYYAYRDSGGWHTEVADPAFGVGTYASLALDSSGNPHISYYDTTNGALRYATKLGGIWDVQTLDSAPPPPLSAPEGGVDGTALPLADTDLREWRYSLPTAETSGEGGTGVLSISVRGRGLYTSIAVDSFNHPSISYYDSLNGDLKYAHWSGSAWDIQTVDSDYDVGMYSSLALDEEGDPHISYYDNTNKTLWYVKWTGSKWDFKRVDPLLAADVGKVDVGLFSSLALDNSSKPHISYYDNKNGNLKYAHQTSSGWTNAIVDSGGDVGQYTSIALANGNPTRPKISYYDATGANLKLATYNGTAWSLQTVHSDDLVGRYTSLALEASNARILYYDSGRGELKYAYPSGGWVIQTVDQALDVGLFSSMKLDSQGNKHIAYFDDLKNNLRYAHWTGAGWDLVTVDNDGDVGSYSSLAVDSSGKPHISYYDATHRHLKYATYVGSGGNCGPSNTWRCVAVDSDNVGMYTSIALDSSGRPRIAYYDNGSNDLKCAFWTGTDWTIRTVDENDNTGLYASLAIDSANAPHISYYNTTTQHLRYAKGSADGSTWDRQTVDQADQSGLYTSMAVDSFNNPRIAYFDDNGDHLRYAYWDGATWQTATIDSDGITGVNPSLAFDNADVPHISYYNLSDRNLLYTYWTPSGWVKQVVDDFGDVGLYSSLTFSSSGTPEISYYDATNGDLKLANASLTHPPFFLPFLVK